MIRYPYYWEDAMELREPFPSLDFSKSKYHKSGLKIFNFHPNTIYLNSSDMKGVNIMKKKYKYIQDAKIEIIKTLVNNNKGVGSMFFQLVKFLSKKENSKMLNELDLIYPCEIRI